MEIKTKMNTDLLSGLARKRTNRIVLLFSGGIDSLAVGLLLINKGYKIYPLFIDYGQSAQTAERYLAKLTSRKVGFEEIKIIETSLIKNLTKSNLLGQSSINDNDAWVPGRNTLFMIIAGIYAQQINADGIAIGYMIDDNFVYGDNDYFHHKTAEHLLSKSFLRPIKVFMPAKAKTKLELVNLLNQANLLSMTTSCWNAKLNGNKVKECHVCANCIEKQKFLDLLKKSVEARTNRETSA